MSLFTKLGGTGRNRDITALVVLAVLTASSLFFVLGRSRSGTLHMLNGLDVPVVVAVNGRTVAIGAHSQSLVVLPNGAYLAKTTTQNGKLVERAVVIADSNHDAVVYNVIGAAPLLDVRLRYSAASRSDDNTRDVTFHGGRRLAVVDDLDYVFTEPPKSISSEKSHGDILKHALMAPPGGASTTTSYLIFTGDRAGEAVDLQRRLIRLDATPLRTLNYMSEAAWMAYGGEEAVVSLLAPSVRLAPASDDDVAARYLLASGCRYACDDVRHLVGSFSGRGCAAAAGLADARARRGRHARRRRCDGRRAARQPRRGARARVVGARRRQLGGVLGPLPPIHEGALRRLRSRGARVVSPGAGQASRCAHPGGARCGLRRRGGVAGSDHVRAARGGRQGAARHVHRQAGARSGAACRDEGRVARHLRSQRPDAARGDARRCPGHRGRGHRERGVGHRARKGEARGGACRTGRARAHAGR